MNKKYQGNEPIRTILVHEFTMGDVEDPEIYAGEPLYNWTQSEEGQWVMKNAIEKPYYQHQLDDHTYGYKFSIFAKLQGPALTEWLLRNNK